jgi:two-component system OmpR family response regulator
LSATHSATSPASRPKPGASRILVVDDDTDLRTHIASYLTAHGYAVAQARDGAEMRRALAAAPADLIVLDLMLPGEDGLSICRRLAKAGAPPIIMLSAMGDETDRVVGLEIGADDYLPKPCSPRELLARIKAVLRRRGQEEPATITDANVTFEGFTLDVFRRRLKAPNGALVVLSTNEFSLLSIFLRHPGAVLGRATIAGLGAIDEAADLDRAIDMLVSRLRRKLRAHGTEDLIATVRGRGYQLIAKVDEGGRHLLSTIGRAPAPQ